MATIDLVVPEINIEFDEAKGLYTGTLVSYKGEKTMSGPDYTSIISALSREYDRECNELLRQIEEGGHSKGATKEKSGRSMGGGGGMGGLDLMAGRGEDQGKAYGLLDLAIGMFKSVFDLLAEIFSFIPRKKLFALRVGGVVVFAKSKRALKKKLIRIRNKQIQKIMQHIRRHQRQHEMNISHNKALQLSARLRNKRQQALALGPRSWEERVARGGAKDKDWKERADVIRTRIKSKKDRARDLWGSR